MAWKPKNGELCCARLEMPNPYEQMDAEAAAAARMLVRLASVGLTWWDVDHFYRLAREYPAEAAELGDPFAAEPGTPSWSCGIDFDRWLELGLRERAEGLDDEEAAELLDLRTRWREVVENEGLPGGRRHFVHFPKMRHLGETWDEDLDDEDLDDEEPPSAYPCGDAERDVARLAEIHITMRTVGGARCGQGSDFRVLSQAYPEEDEWLLDLFGQRRIDNSWMTGVDFDRWAELERRSEAKGLTRAEGKELREIVGAYHDELWSGRHPSGGQMKVTLARRPIRYKDGEEE